MPTESQLLRMVIKDYMIETGETTDINMKLVAKYAVKKRGVKLPPPEDPYDVLAKKLSRSAREEIRHDETTKRPYRAYHSYSVPQPDGKQLHLWMDIDGEAPRPKMVRSVRDRRDQMVGDGVQLTFDCEHWCAIHPNEEPITADMDLTDEVQWRINGMDDEKDKKAG
jgi:hypothetical protein